MDTVDKRPAGYLLQEAVRLTKVPTGGFYEDRRRAPLKIINKNVRIGVAPVNIAF